MKKTLRTLIAYGIFNIATPVFFIIVGAVQFWQRLKNNLPAPESVVDLIGTGCFVGVSVVNMIFLALLFYFGQKENIKPAKILAPIGFLIFAAFLAILCFYTN